MTTAIAGYAYTFKAPPQHHSQAYISPTSSSSSSINGGTSTNNPIAPPTALLWTGLEPWMDAEYARQVCALMRWDAGVLIPPPSTPSHGFSSNAANGPNATHPNNAGYAVLSFACTGAAAAALAQVGVYRLFYSFLSFGAHISRLGEDGCQAHGSAGRIYRVFWRLEPTVWTGPCKIFSA
ncbi:hypothetical protein B0H14DRAFT_3870971 [Mycena olivaceomarginata]|nr:hypothetical protein B0H14DRAFT_3870971 [Mycena olivaceomarginata]